MAGSHCIQCGRPALPQMTLCSDCSAGERTIPSFHQEKTELHRTGIPSTEQTIITDGQRYATSDSVAASPMTSPGYGAAAGTNPQGGTRPGGVPKTETFARESSQPIDRFTLQQVLGEGGQGQVCRAFDNQLQRAVAIKFPRQTGSEDAATILDEARKAARLNHPNVVTIYECGLWQDRPYICMELVDGTSLAAILKEVGRVSPAAFVRYAQQILRALEAAHASGLIHRDLKPHNVLQAKDGALKLTDFGIAHVASNHKQHIDQKTGMMMVAGTPAYMAPEMWRGKTPDRRSDIYAFGCMAYELLAGRPVFSSKDLAQQHIDVQPKPIREFVPSVPPSIERVVMRCLEKNPGDRFQDAQSVREAIEAAARADQITETNYVKATKSGKGANVMAAALLIAVVGGAGFFAAHPTGKKLWNDWTSGVASNDAKDKNAQANDPAEALLAEQRRKAKELLKQSLSPTVTPSEKKSLAAQAAELLPQAERESAMAVVRAAETELAAAGAKKVVENFDSAIKDLSSMIDKDDIEAATAKFADVERAIAATPALAEKKAEVDAMRYRVTSSAAAYFGDVGDFAKAAERYETGAKLAEDAQKPAEKDDFAKRAAVCRELATLEKLAVRQPRFVLVRAKQLVAEGKVLPSGVQFLISEVEANLGQTARAKSGLEQLASVSQRTTTKERAQKIAETIR